MKLCKINIFKNNKFLEIISVGIRLVQTILFIFRRTYQDLFSHKKIITKIVITIIYLI